MSEVELQDRTEEMLAPPKNTSSVFSARPAGTRKADAFTQKAKKRAPGKTSQWQAHRS
jgi:hypothetical protein